MSLLALPNELIVLIASPLDLHDLNSLLCANRQLNNLLTPTLHKSATLPRTIRRRFERINSTLHWAAWNGYTGLFKLLLEKGFDTNDLYGTTHPRLLHFAAHGGSAEIVLTILERGADVNSLSEDITPLYFAVHMGHESVVQLLLAHGASVHGTPPILSWAIGHETYIGWSAAAWSPNVFRMLLAHGADVDARDKYGQTPLHDAVGAGNLGMLGMLLAAGARTGIRGWDGATAFELALKGERGDVVKWLQMGGWMPLLDGKYYDERQPRGPLEHWRLACGNGWGNRLASVWKACTKEDPTASWRKRNKTLGDIHWSYLNRWFLLNNFDQEMEGPRYIHR